ncbi:MAG: PqqD family protein [Candidatus Promineifilaceae bacterium]|nr:PqqD family protein [Candidatus Promineifilaceae bacterium]
MSHATSETVPSLRDGLIWQTLEDGTVVVSVEEGRVRVLNEAGTLIWHMIDGRHTLQQMAENLSQSYEGLTVEAAERDITLFVKSLAERGLISLED